MYNFAALQKERKNNVTTKVSESEKKPIDTYETHCETPRKGHRETPSVLLLIYIGQKPVYKRQKPYIKMYGTRPRFGFFSALQAHYTNNKLIKTTR